MSDRFALGRFVDAQEPVFEQVLRELSEGKKRTHWMWFVFPQVADLGRSPMSERYAIRSAAEAEAFLADPLLGQRLRDCTGLVMAAAESHHVSAHDIFGSPDDSKFQSCMTLFANVSDDPLYRLALERFFDAVEDPPTLIFLRDLR